MNHQCNVLLLFCRAFYVGRRSSYSLLVKSGVRYLPLWKGNFVCLYLKAANARGIFFIIILILKTMSWTSLSPLTKKKKKKIVQFQTLLKLYCQEPSWPLALSTENAALERMDYSCGRATGGGRGYQDWQ